MALSLSDNVNASFLLRFLHYRELFPPVNIICGLFGGSEAAEECMCACVCVCGLRDCAVFKQGEGGERIPALAVS